MRLLRPILLILFLTGISLAGLMVLETILPDAFISGSGGFLIYLFGVSLIFLFFLKRYREGGPSERGQEAPPGKSSEAASQHSSDKRLEDLRARIKDRKKQKD